MASVFDRTAEALQRHTRFERLEARGTVRLALKQSGLEAREVSVEQMLVVLRRVMPGELRARGVPEPEELCELVAGELESSPSGDEPSSSETPDQVFRRLSGK